MPKELVELTVKEISAVDYPANKRRFLIIKRADDIQDDIRVIVRDNIQSDIQDNIHKESMTTQEILDVQENIEDAYEDKCKIIDAFHKSLQLIMHSEDDESTKEAKAVQSVKEFMTLMQPIMQAIEYEDELMAKATIKSEAPEHPEPDVQEQPEPQPMPTPEPHPVEPGEHDEGDDKEDEDAGDMPDTDDTETLKAQLRVMKNRARAAEAELAKATAKPEDIWKGVHPDVRAQFEAMKKQAEEASKIAKQQEYLRKKHEQIEVVKSFTHLPMNPDDDAELLLRLHEKMSKADAERIIKHLRSADAIAKMAGLETEIGKDNAEGEEPSSAWGRIQGLAERMVKAGEATNKSQAIAKIAQDRANRDLYEEYRRESGSMNVL